MKNKSPKSVTKQMIKKLQKDLKKYSLNGVSELAELLDAERFKKTSLLFKSPKKITTQTVYNIFNGLITNGAMTITLHKVGTELLNKYESMVNDN